jgi:hypothetical protein
MILSDPLKLKKLNKSGNEKAKQTEKNMIHFHSFLKAIMMKKSKNSSSKGQKNKPKTLKYPKYFGEK